MERRIFIAVFLSFVVVYAFQALFAPPEPPKPAAQPAQRPVTPAAPVEQPRAPAGEVPAARPLVSDGAERDVVVDTDTVRAVFTNRGGRIKQWLLKQYAQDASGRPVDLVPTGLPADQPLPFSLRIDEGALTQTLNDAIYRASQSGNAITFEYKDASGLEVRKQFTLDPERYLITFSVAVRQGDRELNPYVQWGPGLGDLGAASGGGSYFTGTAVQPPEAIFHDGK